MLFSTVVVLRNFTPPNSPSAPKPPKPRKPPAPPAAGLAPPWPNPDRPDICPNKLALLATAALSCRAELLAAVV